MWRLAWLHTFSWALSFQMRFCDPGVGVYARYCIKILPINYYLCDASSYNLHPPETYTAITIKKIYKGGPALYCLDSFYAHQIPKYMHLKKKKIGFSMGFFGVFYLDCLSVFFNPMHCFFYWKNQHILLYLKFVISVIIQICTIQIKYRERLNQSESCAFTWKDLP